MNNVDMTAKSLADAILESEEYTEYLKARAKIKERPEVYEKVNRYRRKNFEIQNSEQCTNAFLDLDNIEPGILELRTDRDVDEFLVAELRFCRMMQNVYKVIGVDIDFDINILD